MQAVERELTQRLERVRAQIAVRELTSPALVPLAVRAAQLVPTPPRELPLVSCVRQASFQPCRDLVRAQTVQLDNTRFFTFALCVC